MTDIYRQTIPITYHDSALLDHHYGLHHDSTPSVHHDSTPSAHHCRSHFDIAEQKLDSQTLLELSATIKSDIEYNSAKYSQLIYYGTDKVLVELSETQTKAMDNILAVYYLRTLFGQYTSPKLNTQFDLKWDNDDIYVVNVLLGPIWMDDPRQNPLVCY